MQSFNVWGQKAFSWIMQIIEDGLVPGLAETDIVRVHPGQFKSPKGGMMLVHSADYDQVIRIAGSDNRLSRYLLNRTVVLICDGEKDSEQGHFDPSELFAGSEIVVRSAVHRWRLEALPGQLCPIQLSDVWLKAPDQQELDKFLEQEEYNPDNISWIPEHYRRHAASCSDGCEVMLASIAYFIITNVERDLVIRSHFEKLIEAVNQVEWAGDLWSAGADTPIH